MIDVRKVLIVACILMALVTFGCAGTSNYQSTGGPDRFGCGGDIPSDYPPYCRPSH